ncbi:hypothetical protein L227DRAFT_32462 [Lentinus tigrinus ALCF2SS1-6]|uniref:Secreted protein n=1 Tax=Lentinus tigrinus ALCF2SS1-6 TaxID=1328759 RepID=A0A5C2SLH4_9APHY|nr:hypothetical protein L227DRAFT_32462 [Lentinus tigrinus ALCF2SS1-6]
MRLYVLPLFHLLLVEQFTRTPLQHRIEDDREIDMVTSYLATTSAVHRAPLLLPSRPTRPTRGCHGANAECWHRARRSAG